MKSSKKEGQNRKELGLTLWEFKEAFLYNPHKCDKPGLPIVILFEIDSLFKVNISLPYVIISFKDYERCGLWLEPMAWKDS